ncbi:MAG: hypothetical protein WD607_04590 [Candidatus Paceibacterota bacterium]
MNNISISKIAFFNNGQETIKNSDVAATDQIKITVPPEFRILDSEILYQKNKANNFRIENSKNEVLILFDYMDYAEGIIIQLLHTGKSSKDIHIKGSIHGVKKIVEKSLSKSLASRILTSPNNAIKKLVRLPNFIIVFVPILFITPLILLFLSIFNPPEDESIVGYWFSIIFGCLTLALYWVAGFALLKSRLPKGFDIFDDEYLTEKETE